MLVLLAGCGEPPEAPRPQAEPPAVTGIRLETVARERVAEAIEAVGTVRALRQTVLSAKVVAPVVAVHVAEGQRVRAGDLVVSLDDRDLRAQRERAEAGLREARLGVEEADRAIRAAGRGVEVGRVQQDLAESTLRRYQALLERRAVAPQEHDEVAARARSAAAEVQRLEESRAALEVRRRQVMARIEQAEAELRHAGVMLGYARVHAPLDGVVVAKPAEMGMMAAPGVPLVTLDEARYRIEVVVEESQVRRLRLGQTARVTIEALGQEQTGPIVEIAPTADAASRTVVVKIDLVPRPGLRTGTFGRARFTVGQREVLSVPRGAVTDRGALQSVFVVGPDAVARRRLVTIGEARGERVEVLSGLAEGERVAVEGVERLADGRRVEPAG